MSENEEDILTNDVKGVIRPKLSELKGVVMRNTQDFRQVRKKGNRWLWLWEGTGHGIRERKSLCCVLVALVSSDAPVAAEGTGDLDRVEE